MRDYGEPVAPVIELIANDRAAVQPAIVRVAESCRNKDRLVCKSAKLLQAIHVPNAHADATQPALFRDWAAARFTKVADEFAAAMPNESSDAAALHQFRIRAKALRYAIELVAPAFGPELRKELYPIVEELQERLGRVQDHVAAIERCKNWAAHARGESMQETLRELSAAEDRGLADSMREFRSWWTDERMSQVGALLAPPPRSHAERGNEGVVTRRT